VQNTGFSTNKTLNVNGRLISLDTPKVMGILNITPDSFYDGGKFRTDREILSQTEKMVKEGADFIDIGGYSTRPGAEEISVNEELNRTVTTVQLVKKNFPDTIVSVDTFRSTVAQVAVEQGASIINDISGGELDPQMFETVARLRVPYILMHMRGTPKTMKDLTAYENLIKEILDFLQSRLHLLTRLGVKDVIVDPGFGFAKTREQNFQLLDRLDMLGILGRPLLAGLSRKSMVWKTLNLKPEEALNGTSVLNTIALLRGASILRVHDVKEAVEAVELVGEMKRQNPTAVTFS
jgi:dihydropteroate synthase